MPIKTPVAVLVLLAAGLLSPLLPAPAAQAQENPPQRVFGDVIDVRAVQVEVVVTNPQGDRIEGLDASNFRLLVDDREVDLDYFREVRGSEVRAPAATAEGIEPAGPGDGTASVRSFLVFIDDYFTDRGRRHRLLGNLAKNIESLRPGDRMAMVRFEGYGLEVLSPWTDSKEQLQQAVLEARKRTPRELLRATQASVPANPVEAARLLGRQITEVTGAMGAAMRAFSDAPGRKLFLPVTTGWPFDPTRELGNSFTEVAADQRASFEVIPTTTGFQEPGVEGPEDTVLDRPLQRSPESIDPNVDDLTTIADAYRYRSVELLYPLTDTANLLGWTVYPMHVGGPSDVERASLWIIARDTGGRIATQGAANTRPLDPVVDDTGSYYVLGYSPARAQDDARHRLQVELVGESLKKARVRHRREFRDLSRRTQQTLKVEEALLLGEGGGDLDAAFGEVPKRGRGAVELPVTLRIPMDWVTMVPQQDGQYVGALELRVAALDKRGGRSEIPAIPVELEGGKPAPGSVAVYETAIRLRRTEQRVVLFLYDTLSGEVRGTTLAFQP